MLYIIETRESAIELEEFKTLESAEKCIKNFEEIDRKNDEFEPNFYVIRNTQTEEIIS